MKYRKPLKKRLVCFKLMKEVIKKQHIDIDEVIEVWYGRDCLPPGKGFRGRILYIEIWNRSSILI